MDSVRVKISGLNLLRLVDRLVEKKVCVSDIKMSPRSVKFTIDEDNLGVLDKVCKREHKFYQVIGKSGLKSMLRALPKLLGPMLAFIIVFCYLYSMNLFVAKVDLTYSSELEYDIAPAREILQSNGIVPGMKKSKFSVSEIRNLLLIGLDNVEGCEVRLDGNNLFINIYPSTQPYKPSAESIFSEYDAVIVEAQAYSGKLKVKRGDLVQKGDILIENDGGASGKILAKVFFSSTRIYNENQQKIIYTGSEYIARDFVIFPKLRIRGRDNCPFGSFLVETREYYIAKNLFLPILCSERFYREIRIEDEVVPFESVEEKVKEELLREASLKVVPGGEIKGATYSVVTEGCYTRIDCFVETVIDLAK